MAKHIQHRFTRESGHVFTNEELVVGEIGVNIGRGSLSILDDNAKVYDFINEQKVNALVEESAQNLDTKIEGLEERVTSIEEGNLALEDYAKVEDVEKQINDLQETINGQLDGISGQIGDINGVVDDLQSTDEEHSTKITELDTKYNGVNDELIALKTTVSETQTDVDALTDATNELKTDVSDLGTNFDVLSTGVGSLNDRLTKIENYEDLDGTTKILSSSTEPDESLRNDYLWLHEIDDNLNMDEVSLDIRAMQKAIMELTKIVQRHEYAFSNKMDCGTVTDNSTRESLMRSASPLAVDGHFDSTPVLITEMRANDKIAQVKNYYLATDLSYGVELKTSGWQDIILSFDEENKYLWNYMLVSYESGHEDKSTPSLVSVYNDARTIDKFDNYYALSDSSENYPENIDGTYTTVIPEYDENKKYLWCYVKPEYLVDTDDDKPNYEEYEGANVKHLVIKSSKTEQEIRDNLNDILNNELIWCEGNNGLYIKSKNKLVKINGTSGFTPDDDENNEIEEIMTGITFINDGVGAIDFISSNGTKYTMKVNDNGKLCVYNGALDKQHEEPTGNASGKEGDNVSELFLPKLYINSVYCSGIMDSNGNEINEHSINPCSHNFVELSNLTTEDINLNGLSLQYADKGLNWKVLPLWGVIKSGSTFLIRGAQCSLMNLNTTVIKVTDYDMEWKDENGKLMKFDNKSAKFYLTYGTTPCSVENPYLYNSSKPAETQLKYGYIDLVGLGSAGNEPGGQENTSYAYLNSNRLFKKYYSMDNVSQATKAKDKRNNKNDWYYVDLTKTDILPNIESYTPRASSYGKNLFYDKSALDELKPTIATITFGIQATDKEDGNGATRCFNWVSKGYYDEFLWYRKKGDSEWTRVESFKGLTGDIDKHYNRIQQEASNGDVFTSHKLIVKGLTKGVYEYVCGKSLADGTPNSNACIDMREFTVHSDADVNSGFSFIQVSDQQGFNWDEYQVWDYTAKYISENHQDVHFLVNTGDMTQNGNRLNEWIDYFNAKSHLNNLEEMATIGNNDLCPKVVYMLGDGGDSSKINFANINFFYTFEIDVDNPTIFGEGDVLYGYIPSIYSFNYGNVHFLCLNSEISEKTETEILGVSNNKGVIYEKIKEWCERDIQKYSDYNWKIAYCHEMPFTIITDKVMTNFYDPSKNNGKEVESNNYRGGSRINTVTKKQNEYWFGQFCQNNGIRLVMGGHKHTQAITWPIKENVKEDGSVNSMKPIIQVNLSDLLLHFNNSSSLIKIVDDSDLNGQSFPNKWFKEAYQSSTVATRENLLDEYETRAHFCTFELVDSITAPVYSMSQATGYKHTSNKELPGALIPWCRHYYPNVDGSVNTEQRYPFYSVYTVTSNRITIDVKRIKNVLVGGKFNVNEQGAKLKNGSVIVTTDNGLSSDGFNHTNNVVISK